MIRFLVVDDEPATARPLRELLEQDGHQAQASTTGADAVRALESAPFDAVMTDLEMPHVDGAEVLRVARERQPRACLVMVTSHAPARCHELGEAGACIVADKPLDYGAVTREVGACRARGGPSEDGTCRMRAAPPHERLYPVSRDP